MSSAVTGIIYPNDFRLINLTLLTAITTMDFTNILVELSYNEDLFNNTASGYLMVIDSMGYIEKLNLNGNEFIRMTFGKADQPFVAAQTIDKIFRVFKVSKRLAENDGNTETYSLYFCSEELVLSEQYKVSKSYRNSDITTNVKDILTTFLNVPTSKIANIEQTYGVYDLIVPNIKPFDAINWLATYARPMTNPGADFVFYEDKFGYNFRSLQSLMTQTVYNTYTYNPRNLSSDSLTNTQKLYNIISYEILEPYDSLDAINTGVFANRLLSVDPLLRRTKVTDFDYAKYADQSKSLNSFKITNNFANRFSDTVTQTQSAVYKVSYSNFSQKDSAIVAANPDAVQKDVFVETYIPYRTAQLPLDNYTRIKITVPGDPGVTVGRVVNLVLTSKDPNNKAADAYYSGNYLITAVRHMITIHQYRTMIEIAKESVTHQYQDVNNSSTIWKNTVKGVM